jgi:hypothetical protein
MVAKLFPLFLVALSLVAGNVDIPLQGCSKFSILAGTAVAFSGTVTEVHTGWLSFQLSDTLVARFAFAKCLLDF